MWDCATLEFAGRGLTRFVKLNITRSSRACAPDTEPRAYDRTSRELLQQAIAQLCEHGGHVFSVRKVARRAGVGLGHLQYYYSPRKRLLQAIVDATTFEMLAHFEQQIAVQRDPGNRLLAGLDLSLIHI